MDFLKSIALPQSADHIELLHYLLIILLFIFIIFISMIFSGTWLSLHFKKKERIELDNNYKKIAKDLIELVTVNKNIGLIFGLMPLLTVISRILKSLNHHQMSYQTCFVNWSLKVCGISSRQERAVLKRITGSAYLKKILLSLQ